ncbi:hypothetical protein [Chromobacterium violaceum]|uniref:hypothetical protein n=1 Tax=Chromobacterium violaceum TaxID=536 RepID=UPI000AD364FB|nr:hypothetical protein [Chromobacterium violaceum]
MMERTDAGHTLEIRLAAGSDAEALTALYRQLTGDARTRVLPERLDALADGARAQVLVCA